MRRAKKRAEVVKELIKGILGKKGDSAPAENIPDELPPLAEDIVSKAAPAAEKEKQVQAPAPKEEKEAPEELPPLDASAMLDKAADAAEKGTLDDLENLGNELPDPIKKAKMAKKSGPEPKASPDEIKSSKQDYSPAERIKAGVEVGFFSNILEHIRKNEGDKEKLLSGDLFARMGNYWEMRKHQIKTGATMPTEQKLEQDMAAKLEELKNLEQKWQFQRLALEEDLKFIHQREREIQSKISELKMATNEIRMFRNVKPPNYFYMRNGTVLRSLHDLIDILEIVDDETFKHHVGEGRNDFSEWIRHVFKDDKFADRIKNAKTKMEMIEILEKIPIASREDVKTSAMSIITPKKYFWLENGTVIRSLYELSDALGTMNDSLFSRHVNADKNDFARWIRDVLGNSHLADKLEKCRTKEEMLEVLEVFL